MIAIVAAIFIGYLVYIQYKRDVSFNAGAPISADPPVLSCPVTARVHRAFLEVRVSQATLGLSV